MVKKTDTPQDSATQARKRAVAQRAAAPSSELPSGPSQRYFVEKFIPYLINQVASLFNAQFKKDLRSRDLSVMQWRVLAVLHASPNMSLTEISQQASIDQPTLSRIVDQMVERHLLHRVPREVDARFLAITLTDTGEQLFAQTWPLAWKHYERGTSQLTEDEADTLAMLLQKLLTSLKQA